MSHDYESRLRFGSFALVSVVGLLLAVPVAEARPVDCKNPANARDPICQKKKTSPGSGTGHGSNLTGHPKQICLGAKGCADTLADAVNQARDAYNKDRSRGTVVIDVYADTDKIESGGANVDFSVTINNVETGKKRSVGFRPKISGPCITVVGQRGQQPTLTIDHVDLESSCVDARSATVSITASSVSPPQGAPSAISVTTGSLKATGLRLTGGADATGILLRGSPATLSKALIVGPKIGIRAHEGNLTVNESTIRAGSGIWIETPRDESESYEIDISSSSVSGLRAGNDTFGVRIDQDVYGKLTVRGSTISGYGTGISSGSPLSILEKSQILDNSVGVRLGSSASRLGSNTGGQYSYIIDDTAMRNSMNLEIASSLPNLSLSLNKWSSADPKRASVNFGKGINAISPCNIKGLGRGETVPGFNDYDKKLLAGLCTKTGMSVSGGAQ